MKEKTWIPISKGVPAENCKCYVTIKYKTTGGRKTREAVWNKEEQKFIDKDTGNSIENIVIAWMPRSVPEPYY